jgi:hypothetical protein
MTPPQVEPPRITTSKHAHRPSGGLSWKAVLLVAFLAVLGTGAWLYHRTVSIPERMTQEVLRAFREAAQIQPRITVHDQVVFEQTKDAMELAVVTRETHVERETSHEWLGSTKRIRLRGTYNVKAGFDLQEHLLVKIDGRHIRVELPHPKILSIDPLNTEVLVLENGLWNKIRAEELETELRALPDLARTRARQTRLTTEALNTFEKRLRDQFGSEYELEFATPPAPVGPLP